MIIRSLIAIMTFSVVMLRATHVFADSPNHTICKYTLRGAGGTGTFAGRLLEKKPRFGGIMICENIFENRVVESLFLEGPNHYEGYIYYRLTYVEHEFLREKVSISDDQSSYSRIDVENTILMCMENDQCRQGGEVRLAVLNSINPPEIEEVLSLFSGFMSITLRGENRWDIPQEIFKRFGESIEKLKISNISNFKTEDNSDVFQFGLEGPGMTNWNLELWRIGDRVSKVILDFYEP